MVGVVLMTVTDSASVSTWSGALTVIVALALTTTPSTVSVVEAGELKLHLVVAGRHLREAIGAVRIGDGLARAADHRGLVMLTATPGSTAPLLSTARPVMVPVVDCASGRRRAGHEKTCRPTTQERHLPVMSDLQI